MKVLNINSYYFSSSIYQPMEKELINLGIDISTYVPVHKNFSIRREISEEVPNYVDVSICYNKVDRYFYSLKHHKIKKDFLKRYDFKEYDILHAHSLFSNGYIAYLAYRKYNIPYIVAVRSTDIEVFFRKMVHLRNLGIEIMKSAAQIIFISKAHKTECIENYIPEKYKTDIKNKSQILANGVDNFWLNNIKEINFYKLNSPLKLLFIGDDSKRKNLTTVLEACDKLYERGENVQLTVVGNIKNKKMKRKLKNSDIVKYKGEMSKEDLLYTYRNNEIFILPSLTETFGLVYVEAMSQGLPILYTKGQGFDGQFNEGEAGYAVSSLDPKDIANKVLEVQRSYQAISKNNVELVNKFDWKEIAKDYKELYEYRSSNLNESVK